MDATSRSLLTARPLLGLLLALLVGLLSLTTMACDDTDGSGPNDDVGSDTEGADSSTDTVSGDTSGIDAVAEDTRGFDTASDVRPDLCTPSCGGAVCGNDGCGGLCGTCSEGTLCQEGACVPSACPGSCTEDCQQGCFDMGSCTGDGSSLNVHPKVYTAGILIAQGNAANAEVYYRAAGEITWWRAHAPIALPDGRLATSLFWLSAASQYELMVRVDGADACTSFTTLPELPTHETTGTLTVDASASAGGDGSEAAPFATIAEALQAAGPGVDVIVRPGIYHEALSVSVSGEPGRYLRVLGEPGAILEGASREVLTEGLSWRDDGGGVYSAPWSGAPAYLARDGQRLYHYISMAGLQAGLGDDDEAIAEGWFVENSRLSLRSLDDPSAHNWQVPDLGTAFALDGVEWIWIEGMTIRYYGEGAYPKGVDIRASNNVVVRGNHIHDIPSAVWLRRGSNNVRVEGNRIHQSAVHTWPWPAVKGTDHENSAVNVAGGSDAIVADNEIFHIFNGVGTGSFGDDQNPDIALDVDVYGNRLFTVTDDGLEPEGACINNRFWNNTVDTVHNGISLAPITWGPVWVLRNRFTDYTQSGFKVSNDSSGPVFLYHNTCYTDLPEHNGMNISGPFEAMTFRNNVVRGTHYALEMSQGARPNDLDYDNWHTPRGTPVVKWDNVRYDSIAEWCAATGLECTGHGDAPGLAAPGEGRFVLTEVSPNIDGGQRIYGINDAFAGDAPDIGYLELGAAETPVLAP